VGSALIPGTLNDYSSLLNCLYFHSSRPRRLLEVLISTLGSESIVTLHKLLPPAGRASHRSKGGGRGVGVGLHFGRVIISRPRYIFIHRQHRACP